MIISKEVYSNLDIDFIKEKINVYTPYGEALKREMKPLSSDKSHELDIIYRETERIIYILEKHRYTFVEIRNYFKKIKDLTGTFNRILEDEVLSVTEIFEIKSLANIIKRMLEALDKIKEEFPEGTKVTRMESVESLLDPSNLGINTFYIYDEYSPSLAEIRKDMKAIESLIIKIKKDIREKIQNDISIKIRSNDEIIVNKDNSDLIENLRNRNDLIYSAETYMNVTFKIKSTEETYRLEQQITELKKQEEEEEFIVRKRITENLKEEVEFIVENCKCIGRLDLLLARGYFAVGIKGVRPIISKNEILRIVNGRHLKLEFKLIKDKKKYTPVSIDISKGVSCITGANMGGKTVTLKMIGMLVTMAQMGLYVPADSMEFSPRNFVYTSIGDSQSTDKGLSTFGAEIEKMKEAIKMSDLKGLILIDELASGTNPKEGYAISKAIINYLKLRNSITIITTHFDGLADDEQVRHLQVQGLSEVDFAKLLMDLKSRDDMGMDVIHEYMDYRLKEIKNPEEVPKDAINISRLMGLDENILEDAKDILSSFNTNGR